MTWLALSLQSRRRNASLTDDYSSSDSDSEEDYSSSGSDSGEEDDSDEDEIVSQVPPIRSTLTTRRALTGNAIFDYGINIGVENNEEDNNEEEDEVDGDIHNETDEEDELGGDDSDDDEEPVDDNDEEEYLKSLTNKELQDKLRERGLKVSGRKSILINRLMGREETAEIITNTIVCDVTEENLKKLTNAQLQGLLRKRKMKTTGKKSVLINRLLGKDGGKAKQQWKKSLAKSLLSSLINNKKSKIHHMTAEEIWDSDPIFQQYPFDKFEEYLTTLQKAAANEEEIALINDDEFWTEMIAYPRDIVTDRGVPYWDSHPASSLLAEDVRDGTADMIKPKELHQMRIQYTEFPLKVFRQHIYQERRRLREEPGWVEKRNKLAQKMHENEMNALSEEWDTKRKEADMSDMCKMWEQLRLHDDDDDDDEEDDNYDDDE